ncbi:MAG: SulP family inorganic anion transporter [Sodalinema sp.]|uniref:SulP family inorganic anion transporter n=1 Tax=Sodalinema sp. TaxID=3080550 RepID=UPI0012053063|nr:MAG: SulP family inorganic anion transporter [Phormidium sp. SL48-SHIP]
MKIVNYIHTRNLRGDFFGGLTAAIVGLPMALAFGVASGAGPIAGIYSAVLLGFFAALFGGTPTLISNPTGPMTVVFTAVIATFTAKYPDGEGLAIAFTVVMMAGLFQILFGLLRLGKYVTLMPYTVISGFMSGIGVIMIMLQLPPLLGQEGVGGVLATVQALPELISQASLDELGLGLFTLAILFLTPSKIARVCPPQLLALLIGTGVSASLLSGLRIVGEIPAGLPTLYFPTISTPDLQMMVIDAVMLGMLGSIDSLLTSVISDSITQYEHDSNKELMGQGVGNILSGFCGGLPGAGATMGTVVNIQAGGRTALSGMIHAVTLLVFVFAAASFTEIVPLTVLGAIALKVGIDIVDWSFLKRAHHVSLKAAAIMYGVVLLTVFVDLIVAVGVGVFVANVLTIQRLSDVQAKNIKAITNAEEAELLEHEEQLLLEKVQGQVLLLHLGASLSFGAAKAISQRHSLIGDYQVLILDFRDVPMLGVTATLAMEKMVNDALKRGLEVYVVGSSGKVESRLEKFNILSRVPDQHQTATLRDALQQVVDRMADAPMASTV